MKTNSKLKNVSPLFEVWKVVSSSGWPSWLRDVALCLCYHMGKEDDGTPRDYCFPSGESISEETGWDPSTVSRAIKILTEGGEVQIRHRVTYEEDGLTEHDWSEKIAIKIKPIFRKEKRPSKKSINLVNEYHIDWTGLKEEARRKSPDLKRREKKGTKKRLWRVKIMNRVSHLASPPLVTMLRSSVEILLKRSAFSQTVMYLSGRGSRSPQRER